MQKLFSAFPEGAPGIALLLIRLAVSLRLGIPGLQATISAKHFITLQSSFGVLETVSGLAIALGLLTPIMSAFAVISCIATSASWLVAGSPLLSWAGIATADLTIMSIALMLLGPGGLSLDAIFFGRRNVIIPDAKRPFPPDF